MVAPITRFDSIEPQVEVSHITAFQHGAWRKEDAQKNDMPKDPIGVASIDEKGNITLQLRVTGPGFIAHCPELHYTRQDKDYATILKHIGPIRPGESKLVMPFTETPAQSDRQKKQNTKTK